MPSKNEDIRQGSIKCQYHTHCGIYANEIIIATACFKLILIIRGSRVDKGDLHVRYFGSI